MQTIGDCSSFQFIQSMKIDPNGRMWMADNGYVGNTRTPLCPPKMYIIDLEKGRIIKVHTAILKKSTLSNYNTINLDNPLIN
jgi:hypothetical protein